MGGREMLLVIWMSDITCSKCAGDRLKSLKTRCVIVKEIGVNGIEKD